MLEVRHMEKSDREFWYTLDQHLSEEEFENKVNTKRGYVLLKDQCPVGLLRYNLFWDNTPFCTMLILKEAYRCKGYGRVLIEYWEKEIFVIDIPAYAQPMELFLIKELS